MIFDSSILSGEDRGLAYRILGDRDLSQPDVVLAPDGEPYLYRWHLFYDNAIGNDFLHIQVKSDPERPLHDHPWHNFSVILSGGYDELFEPFPRNTGNKEPLLRELRKGDVSYRHATLAHRLILPPDIPYAMTRFVTGPKIRPWGFWYADGWHDAKRHVNDRDPRGSVHVTEEAV